MKINPLYLTAFLAIICSSPSFAQVYKWIDENGKTHFSDKPPSTHSKNIQLESTSSRTSSTLPPPSTEELLRKYDQKRQEKKRTKAKDEQQRSAMNRRCSSLKNRIQYYDGYRHRRTDSKGETYYLTDAEIDKEKQQIQADIRKYCR